MSGDFNNVANQVTSLGADLGIDLNAIGAGTNNNLQLTPQQLAELGIPTGATTPVSASADMLAALTANPTQVSGALNATEVAATKAIADAQEGARIHDASARGAATIISDAKLATAEKLAGGLNRDMADPAELAAAGTGKFGMRTPKELELAAALNIEDPELNNEG